eukprot:c19849_g1_i1 orf=282-1904(+)
MAGHSRISLCLFFTVVMAIAKTSFVTGQAGEWEILIENAGISSMHTAVTHFGSVLMLDRTNIGPSQINLTDGRCRFNPQELVLKHDCTAHSVLFVPGPNTVRPLFIQTDTWCSSGQFVPNGTLVQTGGYHDGNNKIRYFQPCPANETCDWVEEENTLQDGRWYATNQLLPGGTQIIVGGLNVFTAEFLPPTVGASRNVLSFLDQTHDIETDNLYPYVHLLPDGNLFIFANRDSILYNYQTNTVIKSFPTIPGEPRNYPSAGSSVMLPLSALDDYSTVEILICGGAQFGAFRNPEAFLPASQTCGRITVTSMSPNWTMETMPFRRTMGDMLLLPTSDVLIVNGAQNGCQGFGNAINPALHPVLYTVEAELGQRFSILKPTAIPRMYHSTANLLPDGRILLAGSNTHETYNFMADFPTELRVEAFSPDYLNPAYNNSRPEIVRAPKWVKHNETFRLTVALSTKAARDISFNLISAPFATHSYSQGQRLLKLAVAHRRTLRHHRYRMTVTAPPKETIAPSSYYMLFAVHEGIPSSGVWVHVSS